MKTIELDVFVHEDDIEKNQKLVYERVFPQATKMVKARLIIEAPIKTITISEDKFEDAVNSVIRARDGQHIILLALKKELGFN